MGTPAKVCLLAGPVPSVGASPVKALSAAPGWAAKQNFVPLGKPRHRARWWTRSIMLGPGFTLKVLCFDCLGQFCLQVPEWCWDTFVPPLSVGDCGWGSQCDHHTGSTPQQFVTLSSWVCHCGTPWEMGTRATSGCDSTHRPEELRGHPGRRKQLWGKQPHQRFLSHDGEIACGERL